MIFTEIYTNTVFHKYFGYHYEQVHDTLQRATLLYIEEWCLLGCYAVWLL
jgi:hypothetical protein